jgi:hypothetical protein
MNNDKAVEFLRQDEMNQLIGSEPNMITRELMALAGSVIFARAARREMAPVSDFDSRYFMEIMQEFCGKHERIKVILEGRAEELSWGEPNDFQF